MEAHGTGTSLGDPIEVGALGDALGKNRPQDQPLRIGSVKTNFGHLEAAAGIAGLIKVVLALEHGEIPPHLHFKEPNPNIDWEAFPVTVPTERTPWEVTPRIAGVSAFGFSGTNAHVVLEEAPAVEPAEEQPEERSSQLVCLSAKNEEAATELAGRYADYLSSANESRLGDISFTANAGRANFSERMAVVGSSAEELAEQLRRVAASGSVAASARGHVSGGAHPKVAFLFSGQGSQWVGMGRELFDTQPTFRKELELCDEILRNYLEKSVLEVMGRQCVPEDSTAWLPSLRRGHSDWKQMLGSLAQLYVRGQTIDWSGYEAGRKRRRLPLPTYPFQRKRFWIEPEGYGANTGAHAGETRSPTRHPLLGERIYSAAFQNGELQFRIQDWLELAIVPG